MECELATTLSDYGQIVELIAVTPERAADIAACVRRLLTHSAPERFLFRPELLGYFRNVEVVDLLLQVTPRLLSSIAGLRNLRSARFRGTTPLDWDAHVIPFLLAYSTGTFRDSEGEYKLQRSLDPAHFRFEVQTARTSIISVGERSLFLYPGDLSVRNVARMRALREHLHVQTLTLAPAISVPIQEVLDALPELTELRFLTPITQLSIAVTRIWDLLTSSSVTQCIAVLTPQSGVSPQRIREEAEAIAIFLAEQTPLPQILEFNVPVPIRHISQLQRLFPNLRSYHLWVEAGEEALSFTLPAERARFYAAPWNPPSGDDWSTPQYFRVANIEDSLQTPMLMSA